MGRRDARTQVFEGVAFFEGRDAGTLTELAPHADRVQVPAGTVLAVAGRHAWQLLVLVDGTARTSTGGRTGFLGAGQAIAPHAAATLGPFPTTVTTTTDAEVLVVNGPAFVGAASRDRSLIHQRAGAAAPDRAGASSAARAWRRIRRLGGVATAGAVDRAAPTTGPTTGPRPSLDRARAVHAANTNVIAGR